VLQLEGLPIMRDLLQTGTLTILLGLLASLAGAAVAYGIKRVHGFAPAGREEYHDELKLLTEQLIEASQRVDKIIREMATVAKDRATAVQQLEQNLTTLEQKERATNERIKHLEATPLKVADYFSEIVDKGEKRSAKRDYVLFASGAIVSAIVSILLHALGVG
jgi:DNA anti-recombination protein RmuC